MIFTSCVWLARAPKSSFSWGIRTRGTTPILKPKVGRVFNPLHIQSMFHPPSKCKLAISCSYLDKPGSRVTARMSLLQKEVRVCKNTRCNSSQNRPQVMPTCRQHQSMCEHTVLSEFATHPRISTSCRDKPINVKLNEFPLHSLSEDTRIAKVTNR